MVLEPRQRQHRVLLTEDGVDDALHQRLDLLELDLLTEADVAHHVAHDTVGFAVQIASALDLVLHRGLLGRRDDCDRRERLIDFVGGFFLRRGLFQVEPAAGVDVKLMNPQRTHLVDNLR